MHKKLWGGIIAAVVAVFLIPALSKAYIAEFVSATPDVTDWTAEHAPTPPSDTVDIVVLNADVLDETYDVVLSVDSEPVMLVTVGCDLNSWSYDADNSQVSVNVEHTGFIDSLEDEYGGYHPFMIAVVWPVELGEDGPPAEFAGSWMSTNLQDWEMIPPAPGNPVFGFELSGPEGDEGYFHMFIPQATIDLLSSLEGVDLSIEDLAVFEDDEQASISVEEYTAGDYTGAFIDINITFSENQTTATVESLKSAETITKKLTVAKREALSITARKSKIKEGKKAHLFGWLETGKKGKKVTLWQKLTGETEYTKIDSAKTQQSGYYEFSFTPTGTAKYKVKCSEKTSAVKKIKIKS